MQSKDMVIIMNKWYEKAGRDGDVVISSRIRLARNLMDFPFPARLGADEKKAVEAKIKAAVLESNSYISEDFRFLPLESLSDWEAVSLVEKHLVSPEFISGLKGKGILLNSDESISIMINEEDHIRIQVLKEGFALKEAFELADRIDTLISESLQIAYDSHLGYLTQCTTNLGTGMRASVMLHLPALQESGAVSRVSSNLSKLGIIIRGTYGEGTNVIGAMYQLSNQITLGLSEDEAINNLAAITAQLVAEERKIRTELINSLSIQDKIGRATGLLKTSRILSTSEFMNLISFVRFGLSGGLLSGVTQGELNALIANVQPATLGGNLDTSQRDVLRADTVRKALNNIK